MKKEKKNPQKRMEKEEMRQEILNRFSERIRIPEEIVTGSCCMTVTGQREVIIENYKSILEYQSERLVILTRQGRMEICGKRLEISYYGKEEMKIIGKIETLSFGR